MTEYNPENQHTDYNRQGNGEYNGSQPTYGYTQNQSQGYGYQNYGQPGPYPASFNQPYPGYKPRPHVGFGEAIKLHFKYLFHFSGRASRSEYWWVQLFYGLVFLALFFLFIIGMVITVATADSSAASGDNPVGIVFLLVVYVLLIVFALAASITNLALTWRRLQDAGFHGAISLLSFIGAGIVPFIMCFMESNPSGAQYDSPKDVDRP